ncbi:transmembrane protein 272-like [Ruditapes philippinarum]|uniref:transmembrane protein 272-like n=1 Tax=Ruditapes philippinarum TaxID=129788 RepID=UPI00295AB065|nr:transmembrane protein 272-like [Ruditapes philippinarum]
MGIGAGSGEGRGQGQGKGQGHGITDSLFGEKKLKVVKIVVVLIVFVFFGLNIAKIVMGAIYLDDCPIQKLIPIYLIVGGVVPFLFATVFSIIEMYLKKDFPDSEEKMGKIRKVLKAIGVIAFKFTIAWLICGMYQIVVNADLL